MVDKESPRCALSQWKGRMSRSARGPSAQVPYPTDSSTSVDPAQDGADSTSDEDRRITDLDEYLRGRVVTTAQTRTLARLFDLSIVCTRGRIHNAITRRDSCATGGTGRDHLPVQPPPHDADLVEDTASDHDLRGFALSGRGHQDAMPLLKHQRNWSEVYVRSQPPWSARRPDLLDRTVLLPSRVAVNQQPDTLVIAVLLGLVDVV